MPYMSDEIARIMNELMPSPTFDFDPEVMEKRLKKIAARMTEEERELAKEEVSPGVTAAEYIAQVELGREAKAKPVEDSPVTRNKAKEGFGQF